MVNQAKIRKAVKMILEAIGEDVTRPGIVDTPARVARYYAEFIDYDAGNIETTFAHGDTVSQMVVLQDMRVWSLCEHHLLPFWCDMSVAYIPAAGKVIGLSKLARIAHGAAHALNMQERLVSNVALEIMRVTDSSDVAVVAAGLHTCMTMRGIRTHGIMKSSALHGAFRKNAETRNEFFHMTRGDK